MASGLSWDEKYYSPFSIVTRAYFDDNLEYASASKNIRIIDKKENLIIKGDYAEVFEKLDSALITKNPVAINITKSDSLFIPLLAICSALAPVFKSRFFQRAVSG